MKLIDADYVLKCIPQEEINARFVVVNAPTIEAEPVRHGHWVDEHGEYVAIDRNGNTENVSFCSVCGEFLTGSDEYATRGYYCPNCGAKMGGENNKTA